MILLRIGSFGIQLSPCHCEVLLISNPAISTTESPVKAKFYRAFLCARLEKYYMGEQNWKALYKIARRAIVFFGWGGVKIWVGVKKILQTGDAVRKVVFLGN